MDCFRQRFFRKSIFRRKLLRQGGFLRHLRREADGRHVLRRGRFGLPGGFGLGGCNQLPGQEQILLPPHLIPHVGKGILPGEGGAVECQVHPPMGGVEEHQPLFRPQLHPCHALPGQIPGGDEHRIIPLLHFPDQPGGAEAQQQFQGRRIREEAANVDALAIHHAVDEIIPLEMEHQQGAQGAEEEQQHHAQHNAAGKHLLQGGGASGDRLRQEDGQQHHQPGREEDACHAVPAQPVFHGGVGHAPGHPGGGFGQLAAAVGAAFPQGHVFLTFFAIGGDGHRGCSFPLGKMGFISIFGGENPA